MTPKRVLLLLSNFMFLILQLYFSSFNMFIWHLKVLEFYAHKLEKRKGEIKEIPFCGITFFFLVSNREA